MSWFELIQLIFKWLCLQQLCSGSHIFICVNSFDILFQLWNPFRWLFDKFQHFFKIFIFELHGEFWIECWRLWNFRIFPWFFWFGSNSSRLIIWIVVFSYWLNRALFICSSKFRWRSLLESNSCYLSVQSSDCFSFFNFHNFVYNSKFHEILNSFQI